MKYTNHEYKIIYEDEYLFRTREEIITNVLVPWRFRCLFSEILLGHFLGTLT